MPASHCGPIHFIGNDRTTSDRVGDRNGDCIVVDGSGYDFFADQILALDSINPQVAARSLTLMNNWKMFESKRTSRARAALQRIAKTKGLSRDVQEIVDLMLS